MQILLLYYCPQDIDRKLKSLTHTVYAVLLVVNGCYIVVLDLRYFKYYNVPCELNPKFMSGGCVSVDFWLGGLCLSLSLSVSVCPHAIVAILSRGQTTLT